MPSEFKRRYKNLDGMERDSDNALRTAISKVKDGEQILVDPIPVGEVFYE